MGERAQKGSTQVPCQTREREERTLYPHAVQMALATDALGAAAPHTGASKRMEGAFPGSRRPQPAATLRRGGAAGKGV